MMRLTNVLISPLVVCLSLSCLVAQSTDRSSPPAVNSSAISGRVVARGKALEGALITLWQQPLAEPTESNRVTTALTDSAGNYELTNVPSGSYFISATAGGFVTGRENQVFANLRSVTVIAEPRINRINFELVSEGVIKGTVTDADGKPVTHTLITIVPEALTPSVAGPPLYTRNLRTDDQGMFRINGLPAGRYRLAAGYKAEANATLFGHTGYRQTFYPDAADEPHAGVVEIAAGSIVTDVNINVGRVVKTFSVSARVVDSQTGAPVPDIDYALHAYSNGKQIGAVQARERSNTRGEITIRNVPPGEYLIRVPAVRTIIPAGDMPPAPNLFGESKHFQVTDGDVSDIEIAVLKAATVSGFVLIEGLPGLELLARVPQMKVMAMVEPKPGTFSPMMVTNLKPDGSFIFTGLTPGKVRFHFLPPPVGNSLPLRSLRTERDGVKIDGGLEIDAGDQITGLRLVLGYSSGSIQGIVKFTNGSLPSDARLIVRAFMGQEMPPPGYIAVDSRGRFLIQNLPAGEYRLEVGILNSPRPPLAEQKVIVSENGTTEVIVRVALSLPPIPK